jgi:predicted RNA-binding Zn ribbon-like protein
MVRPWRFHLGEGALCLDFVNTLSWRRSTHPIERLRTFSDLVAWARQAGVISRERERDLNIDAAAHPRRSLRTMVAARELRETTFATFAAISEGRRPAANGLRAMEGWIQGAVAHGRLVPSRGRYRWEPSADADGLPSILWRVALSADALLASEDANRIGQCSGRDCRWLWIDRTRNLSRRWCDMAVCGNRAKARRHYARRQGLEASATGRSASRRTRRLAGLAPATGRRSRA